MREQGFCSWSERPFVWSSNLDGVLPWRKLATWAAAGENLYAYCVPPMAPDRRIPPLELSIISHSHGLQVALIAAALGLYIHTLIDICGPVRDDVIAEYGDAAKRNIGHWIHVHADRSDTMQWLGGIGDGAFGIVRAHPLADINHYLPQAGHAKVLTDEPWLQAWIPWLDTIRGRHGRPD
jgi:hypothetical protein